MDNVLTYKWLVGILVVMVLALTASWATELAARVTRVESSVSEIRAEFRAFIAGQTAEHRAISDKLSEITTVLKEMRK